MSEPTNELATEPATEPLPEPFRPNRTTYYELHVRHSATLLSQLKNGDELTVYAQDAVAVPASFDVLRSTVRRWPSPSPASKDWELVSVGPGIRGAGLSATIRALKDGPERPVVCVYGKSTYVEPA